MDTQSSNSLPSPLTGHFTQWPEYQSHENDQKTGSWISDQTLSAQSLNHVDKVKSMLDIAQTAITGNMNLLDRYETSLLKLRKEIVCAESNRVIASYHQKTQALIQSTIDITNSVKEAVQNPGSLKNGATLLAKLNQISQDLTKFYEQIHGYKQVLEKSDLARDCRSHKKNIQPFDDKGLNHPQYLAKFKEWQAQKIVVDTASEIDCWTWKGRLNAICKIKHYVSHLANSLHAAECGLASLQTNVENKEFHKTAVKTENAGASALEFVIELKMPEQPPGNHSPMSSQSPIIEVVIDSLG